MPKVSHKEQLLIQKRELVKAKLERIKNFVALFSDDKSHQIPERSRRCGELWGDFNDIQTEIELFENTAEQQKEREDFEDVYYEVSGQLQKLLDLRSVNPPSPSASNINSANNNNRHSNSDFVPDLSSRVQLPTIQLPNFSGSYEHWLQFYDLFNSLIHNNEALSSIQKLFYLKSSLKGDAAEVIHSLEVSSENYNVAWDLLKQRFENKRLIIHNHMKALFEMPAINKESLSQLRKLVDEVRKNMRALEALKQPVDYWDTPLIYLISTKLDPVTRRDWLSLCESKTRNDNLATMEELMDFLTHKCQLLETLETDKTARHTNLEPNAKNSPSGGKHSSSMGSRTFLTKKTVTETSISCPLCQENHNIFSCQKFLDLSAESRKSEVSNFNLCWNCLRSNHRVKECKSSGCRKCGKKPNTLLHYERSKGDQPSNEGAINYQPSNHQAGPVRNTGSNSTVQSGQNSNPSRTHCTFSSGLDILLSTAVILVRDKSGSFKEGRALLDSGSESNFISEEFRSFLQLDKKGINIPVSGVNSTSTNISSLVKSSIRSRFNAFQVDAAFLVVNNISDRVPLNTISSKSVCIPDDIKLADESFNVSGKIDVLLGASIFWELLCVGQIKLGSNAPILQKTKLGWIVSGTIPCPRKSLRISTKCHFTTNDHLSQQLEKFWVVEEGPASKTMSREEEECEDTFSSTTERDSTGRFIVRLPTRDNVNLLGNTLDAASRRFFALERKLDKNPAVYTQYRNFMEEYESLGHMSKVDETPHNGLVYYLPHHAVIKDSSTTTKLRCVFDASCKGDNGLSLNDTLKVGPKLQDDLFSILGRFRLHNIVLSADIEKMYRQVLINESQRNLQRIVWRSTATEPIQHYQLNTVTYGMASASYLAVRCLQEIGLDCAKDNPDISKIILRDFYVDDLLTGADTTEAAIRIRQKIQDELSKAGFNARKWSSNDPSVLEVTCETQKLTFLPADNKTTKILGLTWEQGEDILKYTVNPIKQDRITKRSVLSIISQIFDPLGLIGPVIVVAKLIIQKLWQLKIKWDESLPIDLHTTWTRYSNRILDLNEIVIPRRAICHQPIEVQLHSFSDASEDAYGACLYLRTTDNNGIHHVHLICAKSRVAPLKKISLPRLELCGAVLAAQLVEKFTKSLDMEIQQSFFWSDSEIVLSWLRSDSGSWKTFVANRVSEIHRLSQQESWSHVRGQENPADIISRGATPTQLKGNRLWFHGPNWLQLDQNQWPKPGFIHVNSESSDLPERRIAVTSLHSRVVDQSIFKLYSTLHHLQRVVACCLRFVTNCKVVERKTGPLTVEELDHSLLVLVKLAQSQEIRLLKKGKPLQNSSHLVPLNPFLDDHGLVRVGGRISKSDVGYDRRHQIILPSKHPLTRLIIRSEHHKQLHAGANALLASIRLRFWPLSARNTIRSVLRNCVTCFRVRPTFKNPLMGELPPARIVPSRPFSNCGLDFLGPFETRTSTLRNCKRVKTYLCIFVCLATKAVHIELAISLSAESFLNCFKRFISRRGRCANIFSDNATNFVGSNNSLVELKNLFNQKSCKDAFAHFFADQSISWHFIPAHSPHHGGLWEAAVKSAKYHIKRVVGNTALTFEEFETVVTQVEACLNSRPLLPISNDPDDLNPLTPGHFLIGAPLTSLPQRDYKNHNPGRLTRYNLLTQMVQHFWQRWSVEYVSNLQQRTKWQRDSNGVIGVNIGSIVILQEDNTPPLCWRLGRITHMHPGADGRVRVVTVKTSTGAVKRAVNRVCVLPTEDD